jgi:ankyrin repeat protein
MNESRVTDRIAAGRTDIALEIANRSEADARGEDAGAILKWCAYFGDVTAIRYLHSRGFSLESLGENYDLGGAAFHGYWRLCAFLVERGADVRRADPQTGETPLHLAASKANSLAHEATIITLLAEGADPNARASHGAQTGAFMRDTRTRGETPMHRAAAFATEAAIDALIAAGGDRTLADAVGDTPLSWASLHLRPSAILRKLCYAGFTLHPAVDWSGDHGAGASGMDRHLLGNPKG